jgi:multimeric flavodoxin WrbA
MQEIYPLLVSFDGIILAAPIFSMGLCGQAKVMIDRLQCFWARKNILKIEVAGVSEAKRRGLFISTAGSNVKGVFDAAIPTVRYFFAMIDIHDFEVLTFSGVDEMGAILRVPDALEKAREAGEKIVRDVRDLR